MDDHEHKRNNQVEDQPDVNHLDIGGGRQSLINLTEEYLSSYCQLQASTSTHADKEGDQYQHGGQVDTNHRLKIGILVEVCTVADNVEDKSGDKHIQHDTKQLPSKSDFHHDSLGVGQVCHSYGHVFYLVLGKKYFFGNLVLFLIENILKIEIFIENILICLTKLRT